MIEIYCGDGKGKTTASVGLAVRGAGHNIKVIFMQFMKGDSSGEIAVLRKIPCVSVYHTPVFYGFVKNMTDEQKREMCGHYSRLIEKAHEEIKNANGEKMIIILDEVIHACNYGLLKEEELLNLIDGCPENIEIVLTGRDPSDELVKRADYISEVKKIKHPFDRGIMAREGIEL